MYRIATHMWSGGKRGKYTAGSEFLILSPEFTWVSPRPGAHVIALPMKIKGGSGGPLRIIAEVP